MSTGDVIAIFPLPNVVFFPKTILPLHIFEQRYRQMVRDTIATKQLIGMFLLKSGWEDDYQGNPPIHAVGCAGEMVRVEDLPDGRYNIVLKGLFRARAMELVQEFPYRKARVEVLPEALHLGEDASRKISKDLWEGFKSLIPPSALHGMEDMPDIGFAGLVNSIAGNLNIDIDEKQELLLENDIGIRADQVRKILKKHTEAAEWTRRFKPLKPTDPSLN